MTHRERFLATLRFQPVDHVPDYEFGAWQQTISRWHTEGMPQGSDDIWYAIEEYFKTDPSVKNLSISTELLPAFEYKVLEEKGDHVVVQGSDGAIAEMLRPELGASIPRYLRHTIETKADWEKMRNERLDPDAPERISKTLDEECRQSLDAEYPTDLTCSSVYGYLRNWMGVENISIAIMEQPEWVLEMMTYMTDMKLKLFEKIAGKCRIDQGSWWEDMCFNKGPLVSPRWFAENMGPQYKRITEFLGRECGCEFHILDCDGNIHELVPLWLEGGINVMFPIEAAHTDPYRIRAEFGARIAMRGCYDKRALIEGKEAIDREFGHLHPLLLGGGFIPHTDHLVPPDVSWDNYCYYRRKKLAFIGKKCIES